MSDRRSSPENTGASAQDSERLAHAEQAYAAGDFRAMRALCDSLESSPDAETVARSRALRGKVEIDAQAIYALAFSFALACVIVLTYVL